MVRYMKPGSRWWVQPYAHFAAEQPNLSTLDLGDRRTGADRSRNSIRNFFLNGATARRMDRAGRRQRRLGTPTTFLTVTGETLAQIQNRVLGDRQHAPPLYTEVEGYTMIRARGGFRFGRHEVVVDS